MPTKQEARIAELERQLADIRDALPKVRKGIADCLGGMYPGSSIWSNHLYDKGWCNGVTTALSVFDRLLAAIEVSTVRIKPKEKP